jgi:cytochrome c
MNLPRLKRSWLLIGALPLALCACSSGGDAARGRELYSKECAACHSLTENADAPLHCGLIGRKAGRVPGYAYSEAMRSSGLVWNEKTLDEFLAGPFIFLPGTIMGFPGFTDATDRADVIAYLQQVSNDPNQCPK